MRIGSLRVLFSLQQQTALGVWENVRTIWGNIRGISGEEISHRVVVRAAAGFEIETGMKLVWGNRSFLIVRVENIKEMNLFLRLEVKESRYVV